MYDTLQSNILLQFYVQHSTALYVSHILLSKNVGQSTLLYNLLFVKTNLIRNGQLCYHDRGSNRLVEECQIHKKSSLIRRQCLSKLRSVGLFGNPVKSARVNCPFLQKTTQNFLLFSHPLGAHSGLPYFQIKWI